MLQNIICVPAQKIELENQVRDKEVASRKLASEIALGRPEGVSVCHAMPCAFVMHQYIEVIRSSSFISSDLCPCILRMRLYTRTHPFAPAYTPQIILEICVHNVIIYCVLNITIT